MPSTLSKELRNTLAKVTGAARIRAESACKAALENLAVHEKDYRSHMSLEQRQLRNQLRARGRALGDHRDERSGTQEIRHLVEAAAYEHWHRLLFTRFLADNNLLHTDEENGSVPVTLQDCDELATEMNARDGFDLACRFAAKTLPGVFRYDDPVLNLRLAINDEVELKKLLDSLTSEVFIADDSLGWTYQFWQEKQKNEINKTDKKRGANEIPAVTQWFTEDYMVEFLLHNTLGAWNAGKLGPIVAGSEEEARTKSALSIKEGLGINWKYLRFTQDEQTNKWLPAAGNFSGWPTETKLIRFLDPCMGSGHFLVFALPIIARIRMEEEGLTIAQAIYATLKDNMFGLELDERCSQIAAFNLALTAWKLGGYQNLPSLHLACSGLAPYSAEKEWVALAGNEDRLKNGITSLYELFKHAPVLGSLINPIDQERTLLEADFHDLQPLLERALEQETKDNTAHEMAVIARGLTKAAEILASKFTLVATNVPYLGRPKQDPILMNYCELRHFKAKADLATCFVERCLDFCSAKGTSALLTPQNWLFLGSYQDFRKEMLEHSSWNILSRLGSGAFETISGEVVNVNLMVFTYEKPSDQTLISGLDVVSSKSAAEKSKGLIEQPCLKVSQVGQLKNPDFRFSFEEQLSEVKLLRNFAECYQGLRTGDRDRFVLSFWEISNFSPFWEAYRNTSKSDNPSEGISEVIRWEQGCGTLHEYARETRDKLHDMHESGNLAWNKFGIAINQMNKLKASLFFGEKFDGNVNVIFPTDYKILPALWVFCSSSQYEKEVRRLDQKMAVTNATLVKVPFDLAYWQKVAAEKYPYGLPKPFSNDPTQWLFNGNPNGPVQPLHVAVARLLGYQWPRQTGSSFPDCPILDADGLQTLADDDGIVCIQSINREQPAANRLRSLLAQALGKFDERSLITTAGKKGSKSTTLEDWLREEFFEQHCELFHNRPFIWHIWDGRKDGFHALVNYHKLDHAMLQKLTYSYLGDWIRHQEEDAKVEKPGADLRLGAAQKLQVQLAKILEGETPYDIFVRWKPISKQSIGWHPDLNDGVRMNIRPFATADILRKRVKIKWEKDRGKEPLREKAEYPWFWCEEEPDTDPNPGKVYSGHRWNNVHLTLAIKRTSSD